MQPPCPHCGFAEISDGATVCQKCGATKQAVAGFWGRSFFGSVGFVVGLIGGFALRLVLPSGLSGFMIVGSFLLAFMVGFMFIEMFAPKRIGWVRES